MAPALHLRRLRFPGLLALLLVVLAPAAHAGAPDWAYDDPVVGYEALEPGPNGGWAGEVTWTVHVLDDGHLYVRVDAMPRSWATTFQQGSWAYAVAPESGVVAGYEDGTGPGGPYAVGDALGLWIDPDRAWTRGDGLRWADGTVAYQGTDVVADVQAHVFRGTVDGREVRVAFARETGVLVGAPWMDGVTLRYDPTVSENVYVGAFESQKALVRMGAWMVPLGIVLIVGIHTVLRRRRERPDVPWPRAFCHACGVPEQTRAYCTRCGAPQEVAP